MEHAPSQPGAPDTVLTSQDFLSAASLAPRYLGESWPLSAHPLSSASLLTPLLLPGLQVRLILSPLPQLQHRSAVSRNDLNHTSQGEGHLQLPCYLVQAQPVQAGHPKGHPRSAPSPINSRSSL